MAGMPGRCPSKRQACSATAAVTSHAARRTHRRRPWAVRKEQVGRADRQAPRINECALLWLKMKCVVSPGFVVGGFTDPQGKRVGLGALLVGYYEGEDFAFAGKIGTGFDTKLLLDLRAQLDQIEIPKAPFTRSKGLPRLRAHWVKPEIVVQVGFIQWTTHGKLRHPRLLSVRTDKDPREVVRE